MESPYRLSRHFFKTTYNESDPMSDIEIKIKSGSALLLGILPFGLTKLFLLIFNLAASLNLGITGTVSAFLMMLSAKTFSYSQWLIWGKYVPFPSSDSTNSRLAQYGWGEQPWIDLGTIFNAFYFPNTLSPEEWNLGDWQEMTI